MAPKRRCHSITEPRSGSGCMRAPRDRAALTYPLPAENWRLSRNYSVGVATQYSTASEATGCRHSIITRTLKTLVECRHPVASLAVLYWVAIMLVSFLTRLTFHTVGGDRVQSRDRSTNDNIWFSYDLNCAVQTRSLGLLGSVIEYNASFVSKLEQYLLTGELASVPRAQLKSNIADK